jgi:hypothetical protein
MTESGARTAANLVVAAVGVAAAYVVLTTPPLRRLATRAVRVWLGASIPIFVVRQVRQAWMESARAA